MLHAQATVGDLRQYLNASLSGLYPEGERSAISRIVLEHLGYPTPVYVQKSYQIAGESLVRQIKEIVNELHRGRPIQYILGRTLFCGLELRVSEEALIPRPETEELVERIRETKDPSPGSVLDMGSGSGCIALALKYYFPAARVVGLEISAGALDLARENSRNMGLEVEWIQGDITTDTWHSQTGRPDLIVSNPPYVRESEKQHMASNVLDHEPHQALFVPDSDPLQFYRSIALYSLRNLAPEGELWLEINEALGKETSLLLVETGFEQIDIYKDIHEKERFIRARR